MLSVVQGLTEFLPVSSSGHLAIVSQMFFGDDAGASFTAVMQIGTETGGADLLRPRHRAHREGMVRRTVRQGEPNARLLAGLVGDPRLRPDRRGRAASSSTTSAATSATCGSSRPRWSSFSAVIAAAEYFGKQTRAIEQFTWRDSLVIGSVQCLALIPGVSRSGATISAGLFLGQKREAAARFGFLLAIPAVLASGLFSLPDAFHPEGAGMSATGPQLLVGTVIAFVIGYAAVAWFLKFLVSHSMYWFVGYRVIVGVVVLILLGTGTIAAQ